MNTLELNTVHGLRANREGEKRLREREKTKGELKRKCERERERERGNRKERRRWRVWRRCCERLIEVGGRKVTPKNEWNRSRL